jgi:hypothetical protein
MVEDYGRREILFVKDLSSSCVVGPFGLSGGLGDEDGRDGMVARITARIRRVGVRHDYRFC